MGEVKFTPGPWEFDTSRIDTEGDGRVITGEVRDQNNHVVVEFSNSECSELIYEDDGEGGGSYVDVQQIANARLIASAPDMLEALENAVLQIEYLHDKYKETGTGNHALNLARAAISKAKGETT